jgi:hypothetical protein
MFTVLDESVLEKVEQKEQTNPPPRKIIDDTRTIYSSHKLGRPRDALWGRPVLCDFGEARIGPPRRHRGLIQPELYRAPEVLFNMSWDSSVDIWSVATLVRRFDPLAAETRVTDTPPCVDRSGTCSKTGISSTPKTRMASRRRRTTSRKWSGIWGCRQASIFDGVR